MNDFENKIRERRINEERKKQAAELNDRYSAALVDVLRTRSGRVVFKHLLLNILKVDADTFSANPLIMAQQCGLRTAALAIKSEITNVCGAETYRAMEDEVI